MEGEVRKTNLTSVSFLLYNGTCTFMSFMEASWIQFDEFETKNFLTVDVMTMSSLTRISLKMTYPGGENLFLYSSFLSMSLHKNQGIMSSIL